MAESDVVKELKLANKMLAKISQQIEKLADSIDDVALGITPLQVQPATKKAAGPRKKAVIPAHLRR